MYYSDVSHGRRHPKSCKVCGEIASDTVRISATGLCPLHSTVRLIENHQQLKGHNGPYFDHWRKRLLASFGVGLLDDTAGKP